MTREELETRVVELAYDKTISEKQIQTLIATAVYVNTESGDDYLYAFVGDLSGEQVESELKKALGDEYEYIADRHIAKSK